MNLRDAAQQALKALKIAQDDCIHGEMAEPSPIFEKAIAALEAALAEPQPEPVADEVKAQALDALNRMQSIWMMSDGRHPRDVLRSFVQLASTPTRRPLAEPQPQPEPVAVGTVGELFTNAAWERLDLRPSTKVYITPPQRQPLSANEVAQMLGQYDYEIHGDWATYIVRMTEKAHGIGGDK